MYCLIPLISRVLKKIRQDVASVIFISRTRQRHYWYLELILLSVHPSRALLLLTSLINARQRQSTSISQPHPATGWMLFLEPLRSTNVQNVFISAVFSTVGQTYVTQWKKVYKLAWTKTFQFLWYPNPYYFRLFIFLWRMQGCPFVRLGFT